MLFIRSYPTLSITLFSFCALAALRKFSQRKSCPEKLKDRREKSFYTLQPIPRVVQPANPIIVCRRDASKLYTSKLYTVSGDDKCNERIVIDYATTDFLGISTNDGAKKHVMDAIRRYGTGSCGPRGFFGTITPHIMVEREFSALFDQPAILYPSAAVVIPSALPIVCGKGDVLLISEAPSLEITRAAAICGAKVIKIPLPYLNLQSLSAHNLVIREREATRTKRMSALKDAMCDYLTSERISGELQKIREELEPILTKASMETKNTCWLLVDTISKDGILCLPEVLRLCERNHVRIFLNDSFGLGTLGGGRGVPEFWCEMGYDTSHHNIDLVAASLEHAFSGLGGICTGALHLVEQQRNMGLGYCFSASAPPGICECIRYALRQMNDTIPILEDTVAALHAALVSADIPFTGIPGFPIVFIKVPQHASSVSIQDNLLHQPGEVSFLISIVDYVTISLSVSATHDKSHLTDLIKTLKKMQI